jgi:hypothetical protein
VWNDTRETNYVEIRFFGLYQILMPVQLDLVPSE